MAEGEGGWWGGWLQQSFQAVKDKSAEAYEFIKRDLTEFSNVVQHDTACSIVATASAVRNKLAVEGSTETTEKVKRSLSNILEVITDTLAPPPDKTIDCDVITLMATPAGTTEVYDSTKARLYSLQADPATYCNEPDGPPQQFEAWLQGFSLEEKKGEISEHLVSSPSIRALYTKMVPAAVAHSEFWQRYFYKVFQLDQEEARRVALKQRAEQVSHSEALGWEEEEEDVEEPRTLPPAADPAPASAPTSALPTSPVLPQTADCDPAVTPSASCESVSLPTQVERRVEPGRLEESSQRMTDTSQEEQEVGHRLPRAEPPPTETDQTAKTRDARGGGGAGDEAAAPRPAPRTETAREDAPQDLRVFELNSDSGKSTPSNNGKKGSSTDISEDWEKDFDLDMTEEEVQLALSKVNATGPLEDDDWEAWE
ncbi:hypothetical protein AAFF_G00185150 [Aldrovandia affinis]|uniref:BSD domain-containing protein n=1 Tax=Aldrovandia affinis TaxID=143900 RepID=A0AAD7RJS3_9TELE|nr:hypothetical protein AAFF_G00185150 [Aldrovandia affinis]